ncbi:purine operon repressor PurR [Scopulibacillus darangshiensis]|uniref:Purine operon repressor PurR n=1 Tax=Scopulibacillus darangshiensis TaxID=442528 RepID=A0A4R2NLV4_9BACL|nr:pur operon repressor [Scopulibacillus darangshiensis]TCP22550.1 purine operon repressor PurR [Scopulibacillus darangshiensis]
MKLKRSSRLVDMTGYLLQRPHQIISLSTFSERYGSAKSSISEDLGIIKENFESQGTGRLVTIAGASGGVKYIPYMEMSDAKELMSLLSGQLSQSDRLLPGGYLYMTDILGQPFYINAIGRMISAVYSKDAIDVVMTMETKGIPLAYAVASQFNVPVVIVRRSSKVTEGSTVSINYVSGSSKRIQTMVLPRRSLTPGSKVLIIDDFMKAGGTMKGMANLLQEFDAEVAGMAVFVETKDKAPKLIDGYLSLLKLSMTEQEQSFAIELGNVFNYYSLEEKI